MSKCVVVASGYFNPLHYGHVSYLQKAKALGTTLIVIVNNDRQVASRMFRMSGSTMGPGQLARDRVRLVRSLSCVDFAVESVDDDDSVCKTLRLLHPDIFANGGTFKATPSEALVCAELNVRMVDGLGIEVMMLQPFTQHYDWGKSRDESAVARLTDIHEVLSSPSSPAGDGVQLRNKTKFAELWMGDHPSGPSQVLGDDGNAESLGDRLQEFSAVLGDKLQGSAQLPFLLKVLSIGKALSIQAHPDRELAARLHSERPDVYKDANHKPEIAIALTEFEALCGFRCVRELLELVRAVPELRCMVGPEAVAAMEESSGDKDRERGALKKAYTHMMHVDDETVCAQLQKLLERAKAPLESGAPEALSTVYMLVQRCYSQFGDDIGIFSLFFLNYAKMSVGDCLYMAQNVPHAYLSGDIVECMACSDNVVRGGLTPKFKDIEVLCEMLNYDAGPPCCIQPVELDGPDVLLYSDPDIEEFQVTHLRMKQGQRRKEAFSLRGPAVGFVLQGSGSLTICGERTLLHMGAVPLFAAGVEAEIDADEDLALFVACCPPEYFTGREELAVLQKRKFQKEISSHNLMSISESS